MSKKLYCSFEGPNGLFAYETFDKINELFWKAKEELLIKGEVYIASEIERLEKKGIPDGYGIQVFIVEGETIERSESNPNIYNLSKKYAVILEKKEFIEMGNELYGNREQIIQEEELLKKEKI